MKKRTKLHPISIILYVLTALASLVVVILVLMAIGEIRERRYPDDYSSSSNYIVYAADSGDYERVLTDVNDYQALQKDLGAAGDCVPLASYYRIAVLQHAYEAAGDSQRAAELESELAALRGELGEFADEAEKIDAMVRQFD